MVNADLLKSHAASYKMNKDNVAEIFKQLFTMHKDMANYWDAEDIDPDYLHKSQKFSMGGQQMLPIFFRLPTAVTDERNWRRTLSEFKEIFEDVNAPMSEWKNMKEPFLETMRIHAGGLSAEQKKEWSALLDKAYGDMKGFGWY